MAGQNQQNSNNRFLALSSSVAHTCGAPFSLRGDHSWAMDLSQHNNIEHVCCQIMIPKSGDAVEHVRTPLQGELVKK